MPEFTWNFNWRYTYRYPKTIYRCTLYSVHCTVQYSPDIDQPIAIFCVVIFRGGAKLFIVPYLLRQLRSCISETLMKIFICWVTADENKYLLFCQIRHVFRFVLIDKQGNAHGDKACVCQAFFNKVVNWEFSTELDPICK